ncbi:hypothetical protein IPM19_03845 [bacterium]|nr:MAG: hypothetical protein IPM19_03845 [bacterium]
MAKKKISIKEIFAGLQDQMEARLTLNKKVLNHPVTKGDASELEWLDMLRHYLPRRYCVDKAFVIDNKGNISEQIDIVIFDRHYSPFILHQNGAIYIPAECVYAVIEVKPTISTATIEYAAKKAASVRRLQRSSAKIVQADGREFEPKKAPRIIAGLLAIDGNCSNAALNKLKKMNETQLINMGCALSGTFFNVLDYKPWGKLNKARDYQVKNNDRNSLILFFLTLVKELQKMGTVPAIEIGTYLDNL